MTRDVWYQDVTMLVLERELYMVHTPLIVTIVMKVPAGVVLWVLLRVLDVILGRSGCVQSGKSA